MIRDVQGSDTFAFVDEIDPQLTQYFPCAIAETPGAPRGPLTAKNEGRDAVALSWQPPLDDGGSPIVSYIVDKLDVQRGGWVRAARVAGDVTAYKLSGLNVGHDYNFRVYAENKAGVGQPLDLKTLIKAKSVFGGYILGIRFF